VRCGASRALARSTSSKVIGQVVGAVTVTSVVGGTLSVVRAKERA
jgi:hypothetical protein